MQRVTLLASAFALLLLAAKVNAEIPQNAVWIDVRSLPEFSAGHLAGAHSIPYDGIESGITTLGTPKDAPLYLYCAVGGRAGIAKERLERMGFSNVTNVGGLDDARRLVRSDSAPGGPEN